MPKAESITKITLCRRKSWSLKNKALDQVETPDSRAILIEWLKSEGADFYEPLLMG